MPKMAATMLGFILVAGSIGFNIMQYPMVWDMVGPISQATPAIRPVPSVITPQPTKSECPSPVSMQKSSDMSLATTRVEVRPVPETINKIMTDTSQPTEAVLPSQTEARSDGNQALIGEEVRKPLVPVLPLSVPRNNSGNSDFTAEIRRLPPVDRYGPNPNDYNTQKYVAGSNPVYPSTNAP